MTAWPSIQLEGPAVTVATGYDTGRQVDGHRRHDRDQYGRSRDRSQCDKPPRESDHYRSRSRSRSVDSRGSQRSDFSRDSAHSRSRSPGDRSSRNDARDHRGRPDRLGRDPRDQRGRASSLDLATRRLRERDQGPDDRGRPDRGHPGQQPGRQRTPPTSPRGNPSAELNAVQQPPSVKTAEPPRRSQSPSQVRTNLPGATEPAAAWDRLSHESRLRQQTIVVQSSEHLDGSTSISSNSASTGNILAVSREYENFGLPRTAAIQQRQQIIDADDKISSESRLRRLALREQKAKRDSINMPAADKSIALQHMLRVHDDRASIHHITKIDGRPAALVDPGAQVSASSDFDLEQCITVIDPTDRVDLKSFSGNRERLLCLGSTTKQKICLTTTLEH